MPAKHAYDLVVVSSEYVDRQGNRKKKWLTIGRVFMNDKGYFAVLDRYINLAGLPVGDRDGVMVSFFEPKPTGGAGGTPTGTSRPASDFDDDIPF